MMIHLINGKKYKAKIVLGIAQRLVATNDDVKSELVKAGFTDVSVTGDGKYREATGTWGGNTQEAPIPEQVKEVVMI